MQLSRRIALSSVLALLAMAQIALAQNGKLRGYVYDADSDNESLIGATVAAYQGSRMVKAGVTDIDGKFELYPLPAGEYEIHCIYTGYQKQIKTGVNILVDKTVRINFYMKSKNDVMDEVVIEEHNPLIGADQPTKTFTAAEIEKIGGRDVNQVITTSANVYSQDDGEDLNIRGMRGEDNNVFVNGVRVPRGSYPPVEAIEQIEVIDGGISARYGDAIGGIISITTKKAASDFRGGFQLETSRPFDPWNYDLVGANLTGPLWKKTVYNEDSTSTRERTILDFFGLVQYTHHRDQDPSALGYWRMKPDAVDRIERQPLFERRNGDIVASPSDTNMVGFDDFEKVDYNPNSRSHQFRSNLTIGFAPSDNILISAGGNFDYTSAHNASANTRGALTFDKRDVFNYETKPRVQAYNGNAFVRFLQQFPSNEDDFVKNVYYQVQLDYTRASSVSVDPRFGEDIGPQGYVGSFEGIAEDTEIPVGGDFTIQEINASGDTIERNLQSTGLRNYTLKNQQPFGGGINFTPFDYNEQMAYTTNYLLYELGRFDDYNSGFGQGAVFPMLNQGGAVNANGFGRYSVPPISGYTSFAEPLPGAGVYSSPGVFNFHYSRQDREQYRFTLQSSATIGNHSIKAGLEFEQRVFSSYTVNLHPLQVGRSLINSHIAAGWDAPGRYSYDTIRTPSPADSSIIIETIEVNRTNTYSTNPDGSIQGQSDFDRKLRERLGVGPEVMINLEDAEVYHPEDMSLEDFTVEELYVGGVSPAALYQGYDIYGNRKRSSSDWYSFFTDPNKPIDAFRPIYMAGYIEDKFEIDKIIVRAGVRVDRYDMNQPVLKDKYSFVEATRAGEIPDEAYREMNDSEVQGRPSTVDDDYAVYVEEDPADFNGSNYGDFTIVGYRDGDRWFDANGTEVTNQQELAQQSSDGALNIFHQAPDNISNPTAAQLYGTSRLTLDAFEDYDPQIRVVPRLSITFPVSEQSLFFAHYDVLTQRPRAYFPRARIGGGNAVGESYGSPLQYFTLNQTRGNNFLVNPNLKPQQKVDYQVGFQQALSRNLAFKLKAFYSEFRDLIQVINVQGAYPANYRTNGNEDFGFVKGFTFSLDLRRTRNFRMNGSYTLQFAEGSASDFSGNLVNTGVATIKSVYPLNYDQRHAFKLNMDYRFPFGDKYNGPAGDIPRKILQGLGLNITFFAGSGTPYTELGGIPGVENSYTIEGQVNGNRLPWTNRTSLRLDKTFYPFKKTRGKGENAEQIPDMGKSLNAYIYITNLFDARNVLQVYPHTGDPEDDGYLASDFGQNELSVNQTNDELEAFYYRMALMNPNWISLPRWIKMGVQYNF